jgi:hypothetical protein
MGLTILALLLASGSAPAEETDAKPAAKEKIVCVDQAVTGSRLSKRRVCQTASEWERDSRDAGRMLETMHRSMPNPGNGGLGN